MANLSRKTAKIFGETASATGNDPAIGQFGSAKAGTYVGTNDIDTIQGLTAWSNGWIDAVTPTHQFPTLPEMTGVHNVLSYQEAYLLQKGVAEWDSGTTYYVGDICKGVGTGKLYRSLQNSNLNNAVSNTSYWAELVVLPSQTGNSGKYLATDGTNPYWAAYQGGGADTDLSNLTTTGEGRLHALKSYSDEGELLTDK